MSLFTRMLNGKNNTRYNDDPTWMFVQILLNARFILLFICLQLLSLVVDCAITMMKLHFKRLVGYSNHPQELNNCWV